MIATNGKKACVIMDGDKVVTKILVLQPVYELEGDLLLKFAVDVAKGTTLFMIDSSTEITANDDYKAGDYLYFEKGTFQPTRVRFYINGSTIYNYYAEIYFLKGFDESQITNISYMFGGWPSGPQGLKLVTKIDMSHLDTSKMTTMAEVFGGCTHLTTIRQNFNTSKVTSMNALCVDCGNLVSVDFTNLDTKNVMNMAHMFNNCHSLTSLDVSNFDTSKVTTINSMFSHCSSLTSLDVSNFDTSKVTNMSYMFSSSTSLTSLDVSNFDTKNVTSMMSMFYNCPSLTNLIFGSKWGTQTSTEANALTLDLSTCGSSKSYKLTDETYNSMLTMYDRASNGLTTMTIKFSKSHNLPDGFAEKMSALGYTITLV